VDGLEVDSTGFEVGVNMAATPGAVVYRSDLIELIQYKPADKQVHAVPLLFCPPWINKYYIMEPGTGRSLNRVGGPARTHCFAITTEPRRDHARPAVPGLPVKGLDAVRVVREITGRCRGQTLSSVSGDTDGAGSGYNAANGDRSIKSATFLNTLTDFTTPGVLGVFTDEPTIAGLEKQMAKAGFLDSSNMAHTFDALRANDLIFSYVVNNWLLGNKPPAFDLLVWNKDSTECQPRCIRST